MASSSGTVLYLQFTAMACDSVDVENFRLPDDIGDARFHETCVHCYDTFVCERHSVALFVGLGARAALHGFLAWLARAKRCSSRLFGDFQLTINATFAGENVNGKKSA